MRRERKKIEIPDFQVRSFKGGLDNSGDEYLSREGGERIGVGLGEMNAMIEVLKKGRERKRRE